MSYLKKSDMTKSIKKLHKDYQTKNVIYNKSRELLRDSKVTIFEIHRNKKVNLTIKKLIKNKQELEKFMKKEKVAFNNLYNQAIQEYVEAITLHHFLKDKKIPGIEELKVNIEDYFCGLSDLTGELARRAVLKAIKKDKKEINEIKKVIEEIMGYIILIDMKNGELRKKSDAIKWNLKKVEQILYELET